MKLPRMIRNLWIYRRFLALTLLLVVACSFLVSNWKPVKVSFLFLGEIDSTSGIVMLVSAGSGAAVCWLIMTFRRAWREARGQRTISEQPSPVAPAQNERPVSTRDETEREGPLATGP